MTVPSSHRPVPLFGRTDLQKQMAVYGGEDCVIIRDPLSLEYHRISLHQDRLLQLLDGRMPLKEIVAALRHEFPGENFDADRVQRMILELNEKNLLWNRRLAGNLRDLELSKRTFLQWVSLIFRHLFFFRLPAWHAEPVLNALLPSGRVLFSRLGICLTAVMMFVAGAFLLSRFDEFQSRLPGLDSLWTRRDVLMLWLLIGGSKVIHELGHGVACLLQGGKCHGIGLAFLMFSPCLYCDVSDAWMLKSKRSRILIALAGIWIELMISMCCLLVWWFSAPGLIHDLSLQMCVVTSVSTILFNLNPLLRYDGYYVLCDLVEIPNLQQQSQRVVQECIRWGFWGIPPGRETTSTPGRGGWLLLYGVCSSAYKWSIIIGIGYFLHQLLQPMGLQFLSWCYVAVSVCAAATALWMMGRSVMTSPAWSVGRMLRGCLAGGLLTLGFWGLWNCPVPQRFNAPLLVEPHRVQHVYIESPGILTEVLAAEGETVEEGAALAVLYDPDLRSQLIESERVYRQSAVDLQLAQATSDPDLAKLARQSLQTAKLQIQDSLERLERLTVKAPCSGKMISAPERDLGVSEDANQFAGANKTLLSQSHMGAALERRTHVCSLAPSEQWQTVAWVTEEESLSLSNDQPVEVMLESFPGQKIQGTIERISPAGGAIIPRELSSRFGGHVRSQQTGHGEVATEKMYQVTILLDSCDLPLSMGLRGIARFQRPPQQVGEWLICSFYRVFPGW